MTNSIRTFPTMRNLAILLSLQLLNCRPAGSEPEGAAGAPSEPGNEAGQSGAPTGSGGAPMGTGGQPEGQAGGSAGDQQAGSGGDLGEAEGGSGGVQEPAGQAGEGSSGEGGRVGSGGTDSADSAGAGGDSGEDPDVGPNGAIVTSLAAGYAFTCGLTRAGDVKCWGENSYGTLGNGQTAGRTGEAALVLQGAKSISAGDWHACAVKLDDSLVCWGFNEYQQLDPETGLQGVGSPTPLLGYSGIATHVGVGTNRHSCLIDDIGGILCWGQNSNYQLGALEPTASGAPIAVSGLATGFKSVVAGEDHTCGLTTSGGVKCWGSNQFGQLGDPDFTELRSADPIEVKGLTGVQKLGAGLRYTCALTQNAVVCWGLGSYGALGNGSTEIRTSPTQVSGLVAGVKDFASGDGHSCALMQAGGTLLCWGYNVNGQLGNQPQDIEINEYEASPVAAIGISDVIAVTVGNTHTCAAFAQGGVSCWGAGWASGAPQSTNQLTPFGIEGF